jgi:hypothetical protein
MHIGISHQSLEGTALLEMTSIDLKLGNEGR